MRFGVLSQWYDPEPGPAAIPGGLARELARRGHEVTVLTGFPNYPTGRIYPGFRMKPTSTFRESSNLIVRRVALYPSHDDSSAHRILNYCSFGLSAATLGLGALRGLDAVWVYNSPATVALPMWASRYLLGVPQVLHVMDLWPDSILLSGFGLGSAGGVVKRSLDAWCSAMYRSASAVAFVTPGLGVELERRGVPKEKLTFAPVWADAVVAAASPAVPRSVWGVGEGELLVLYAGALGSAQGLDAFVEALALIEGEISVHCLIAGSGTEEHSLQERVRQRGLKRIHFLGQVPRDELPAIMAAADIHLVSLRPSLLSEITMPSKMHTTLAAGKPFIAAVEGDARKAATESGAAILATPGDPRSIADALLRASSIGRLELAQMGSAGKAYYQSVFSLDVGVDRIEELLIEASRKSKSRG